MTLARLQSLLGVVPLGIYLSYHLVDQWPAVHGREAWVVRAVLHPSSAWVVALVGVAWLAHVVLGITRLARDRRADSGVRVRYVQALTGLLLAGFVVFHVLEVWAPGTGHHTGVRDAYAVLWHSAGRPLHLAIYLIGISAAWFHFAHGLSRATQTFGFAQSERAVLLSRLLCGALGFLMWLLTLQLLAHYALGGPLIAF